MELSNVRWMEVNEDGAAQGKAEPAGMGNVFRNERGERRYFYYFFGPNMKESNEEDVLTIRETLKIIKDKFSRNFLVDRHWTSTIKWAVKIGGDYHYCLQ